MLRAGWFVEAADTAGALAEFVAAVGPAFCARETGIKTVSAVTAPISFKSTLLILTSVWTLENAQFCNIFSYAVLRGKIVSNLLRRGVSRRFQAREGRGQLLRAQPILL